MKFKKFAKYYIIATQGLCSIIALTFIGLFIGYKIDKESVLPAVFAVVGLLCGLASFIYYLLKYQSRIDKEKKKEVSKGEESES